MAIYRTYHCSDCDRDFEIFHMSRDEPPPDECPYCTAEPEAPYLPLPRGGKMIGSNISKAVDLTFKHVEESGQRAFEASGNPAAKVTNMKDNLREGDVAAVVPQPSREYQQAVASMGGSGGFGAGTPVAGDTFQPAAVLPSLRGTGNAMPALQQMSRPDAPHRRLTGRFQRPK
jgi:DNA-directed RNA polymerase subunit RPC12/RpoP